MQNLISSGYDRILRISRVHFQDCRAVHGPSSLIELRRVFNRRRNGVLDVIFRIFPRFTTSGTHFSLVSFTFRSDGLTRFDFPNFFHRFYLLLRVSILTHFELTNFFPAFYLFNFDGFFPIFLGRYNKYSRELPQTPWILDGKKVFETSVEELIASKLKDKLKIDGKSLQYIRISASNNF